MFSLFYINFELYWYFRSIKKNDIFKLYNKFKNMK